MIEKTQFRVMMRQSLEKRIDERSKLSEGGQFKPRHKGIKGLML